MLFQSSNPDTAGKMRKAIIFVPDNCFPFSRRTLVSSSLQVGSVSDICRCASCRGENGSTLAPKAADGGRFEWFASVIMWPPVRKGIDKTCSELSFYVNVSVLVGALQRNYAESLWGKAAVQLLRFGTLLLVMTEWCGDNCKMSQYRDDKRKNQPSI